LGQKKNPADGSLSGVTKLRHGLPVFCSENDDNSLIGRMLFRSMKIFPGGRTGWPDTNPAPRESYFNTSLFSNENLGQLGNSPEALLPRTWTNN